MQIEGTITHRIFLHGLWSPLCSGLRTLQIWHLLPKSELGKRQHADIAYRTNGAGMGGLGHQSPLGP